MQGASSTNTFSKNSLKQPSTSPHKGLSETPGSALDAEGVFVPTHPAPARSPFMGQEWHHHLSTSAGEPQDALPAPAQAVDMLVATLCLFPVSWPRASVLKPRDWCITSLSSREASGRLYLEH